MVFFVESFFKTKPFVELALEYQGKDIVFRFIIECIVT